METLAGNAFPTVNYDGIFTMERMSREDVVKGMDGLGVSI